MISIICYIYTSINKTTIIDAITGNNITDNDQYTSLLFIDLLRL